MAQLTIADDNQEDQVGIVAKTKAVDHQVNQASDQDIDQGYGNEDQPGELHQLVGAQARQRATYPDEDEAEQVDLDDEVAYRKRLPSRPQPR